MHIKLLAGVAGLVTVTAFAAYRLGHYAGEEAGRAAVRSSFDWLDLAAPNGASPRDAREALAADFASVETPVLGAAPPALGSTSPVHAAALRAATPADLLTIETEFAQAYATYALAARADQAGIETLIRDAQAINRPDDRVHMTSVFLSRYVEIDPHAALEFLRAERLEPKRSYLAHLFASWTYEDVDTAIAATSALSAGDRMAANEGIVRVFDDQGAAKLAEIAKRLSVGGTPPAMDPVAVVSLAATDPRAALDQVDFLPRDVRNNVTMAIGAAWAARDAEDAYRNVRARPADPLKQPLLAGVFLQWVATAPERVFEILDAGVPADEQRLIVSYAVARFARARPQAAFELVGSLDNADAHDAALRVTLQQWAQQDAPGAAAALETLDDSAARAHALIVAREYARAAPDKALDWAIRRDEGYDVTWAYVLSEIAGQDMQRGLDVAAAAPSEQRSSAFFAVVTAAAQSDPAAAAQYWGRLPAEARSNAARQIARQWVQRDASAAEAWVLALPRGADRDAGLSALLSGDAIDAQDAPRLVNAIDADAERGTAALAVVRRVLRTGSALDAELLLNRMQLSAERRAAAQRLLDGGSLAVP